MRRQQKEQIAVNIKVIHNLKKSIRQTRREAKARPREERSLSSKSTRSLQKVKIVKGRVLQPSVQQWR